MRELIDNVQCIGTESKLIDCSHNVNQQISYSTPKVECQHGENDLTAIKTFFIFTLLLYCLLCKSSFLCFHKPHPLPLRRSWTPTLWNECAQASNK